MSAVAADDRLAVIAGAFRASEAIYAGMGASLYAEFCREGADDPDLLALADLGMEGAKPSHLFSAVHYLLLGAPDDPLAQWFATLTDHPRAPAGAYPELARFCREHHDDLAALLRTRSVQTTYAERCRAILPTMCAVAREAGEPLNLIEIGCSAGVLLVFDKFAYRYDGGAVIGAPDAPLLLEGSLHGDPALFIPEIGQRTGIDLHTIDVGSAEERRWLLALCFPELRDEQARLAKALDVIAATPITMLEGDGLARLREAFAATPGPLCVFHSACLFYWPREAREALEEYLREQSRERTFWRISIEPSDRFDEWHKGRADADAIADDSGARAKRTTGEIAISRYEGGEAHRRVAGYVNSDYGEIDWCG